MKITIKMQRGTIDCELESGTVRTVPRVTCKGCGKMIFFARTAKGKLMPVSELGDHSLVAHFYDCPAAKKFRKRDLHERIANGDETL